MFKFAIPSYLKVRQKITAFSYQSYIQAPGPNELFRIKQ